MIKAGPKCHAYQATLSNTLCLLGLSKGPQSILPATECSIKHLAKDWMDMCDPDISMEG